MFPRAALLFRGTRTLISTPISSSTLLRLQLASRRHYASQPSKPISATGEFYKTFTRPVAKTLLLALFTYQVVYWGWAKLEQDEIKEERTGNSVS
jgi:hypothetical protein